jgi:fatty acid desaturase
MHKPGQVAEARAEFRSLRKPPLSNAKAIERKPLLEGELRRVRYVHAALTFPAAVLLALSALDLFKWPFNIAAMLVGCSLLLLSIRTAGKLNRAAAKLWRDRQPSGDDSIALAVRSGVLGTASGFWYRQYEGSKKFMVALLVALLVFSLAIVIRTLLKQVDVGLVTLGKACVAVGVAQMLVGLWTVLAIFMHKSAFLRDFQTMFEDATAEDAKDAYRGLIAFA